MAQDARPQPVATLRAITYRLASTSTKDLPQIAPQIAASLWNCRELLSSSGELKKQNNDASILVHRFQTHLSSLLQDRTGEGRWSAVILVKATVEAGGVETLTKSNVWVRSLLGILKKSDPPTTRRLAVLTLTRIFMLTWDHSNLVREITTPALPTFIASCLSSAENKQCSARELHIILEAFATLIPKHPTIFRTHENRVRTLALKILSSLGYDESSSYFTNDHRNVARSLLVLLHHCSPKQGAADKWDETLKTTVTAVHATCDRVFRGVIESWQSVAGVQSSIPTRTLLAGDATLEEDDNIGLAGWRGLHRGGERLLCLLDLLKTEMEIPTAAVNVRLGLIADVLNRLFSLTVPQSGNVTIQANTQVAKDERELVFTLLPGIHVHAIRLLESMFVRLGIVLVPVVQAMWFRIQMVFQAEKFDTGIRTVIYCVLKESLVINGLSHMKQDVTDIEAIMQSCCEDLLPSAAKTSSNVAKKPNGVLPPPALVNATSKAQDSVPATVTELQQAAESLLSIALSKLNPAHVPARLRRAMERTAALTQNKDALIACVLNPARNGKGEIQMSLLPLLARQYAECAEVEALIRPRMPVVGSKRTSEGNEDSGEDGEREGTLDEPLDRFHVKEPTGGKDLEDEPTADLLSALGQDQAHTTKESPSEDLYTVSPPRQSLEDVLGTSIDEHSNKRSAPDDAHLKFSAKRLRAPPMAESLLTSAADTPPGPHNSHANVPTTVTADGSQSGLMSELELSPQTVTLPAAPVHASARGNVDSGSDDSDFEMPPLTMEPDTESEDEDEGGQ